MLSKASSKLLLALLAFNLIGASTDAGAERSLTVEDMLQLEEFGRGMFSPDGKWLALEKLRSAADISHEGIDHERRFGRAQVFLHKLEKDGAVKPLEELLSSEDRQTAADNNYALLGWSPTGDYLALWSVRDGYRLGIAIWSAETGELREYAGAVELARGNSKPKWMSDRELLFAVAAFPSNTLLGAADQMATVKRRATAAFRGEAASVSVYSTHADEIPRAHNEGELRILNADTALVSPVASGRFQEFILNPQKDAVAAIRLAEPLDSTVTPRDGRVNNYHGRRRELVLITELGENNREHTIEEVDTGEETVSWSADGNSVSFIGYGGEALAQLGAYRYEAGSGSPKKLDTEGVGLSGRTEQSLDRLYQTGWVQGQPVVLGATESAGLKEKPTLSSLSQFTSGEAKRLDVYLLGKQKPKILTAWASESVTDIHVGNAGDEVYVNADQRLWRLRLDGKAHAAQGDETSPVVAMFPRLQGTTSAVPPMLADPDHLAGFALSDGKPAFTVFDMGDQSVDTIAIPDPNAQPGAFSAALDRGLFVVNTGAERRVFLADASGRETRQLMHLNRHTREIRRPRLESFSYEAANGEQHIAWLIYPENYEKGKRYPTVVAVYPGFIQNAAMPFMGGQLTPISMMNVQYFATRGYAVLMPSVPVPPYQPEVNPVDHIADGVFPAMDELVKMGIADPARFVVTGQSGGGYATAHLLATSKRFKAGISAAGLYNLFNLHGHLLPEERNSELVIPSGRNNLDQLVERGAINMGKPPWEDPERYIRNSPYFSVRNITAPLLIIHGELDFNYADAEQMYGALARLGRDVTLLHYRGESHYIQNAVNVRDQWKRIFSWLEERL